MSVKDWLKFALWTLYYVLIALGLILGKDVVVPPPQVEPELYFGWVDPSTQKTLPDRVADLEKRVTGCDCKPCCKTTCEPCGKK